MTQPARNTGPFTLARPENSIKITAMIGTGLIATPTANVSTSLIPCAMPRPSRGGAAGRFPPPRVWLRSRGSPWAAARFAARP